VNDEFFITFQAYYEIEPQTWWDYYAQRVRASDGALLGSNITISATSISDENGDVAYDSDLNRYLVIYQWGSPGPWGQFVSAAGALIGERFSIGLTEPFHGGMPGIAWHPLTKEYLATWASCCSYSNFGRRLSQNGASLSEPFRINGYAVGNGNWDPLPIANTANGEFLINWHNSYDTVYVRRYKPYSIPIDNEAPASASGLSASRYPTSVRLCFTHSASSDACGTMVRMKVGSVPASPADGELVADVPNAPSRSDCIEKDGLTSGITYCFAAFTHDPAPNYADAASKCLTLQAGDFDADLDVDQADFGHFQNCLGDMGAPYVAGCRDADLDENGAVDANDFAPFQQCWSGPNLPPGC
jgi:hypothetical protein